MSRNQLNLQDAFLNQLRKERIPVTMYLVNGFQIKGTVKGFDNFTVIIELEGRQQMVYKHAISTIAPVRQISILSSDVNKSDDE
ncbi:MAG TPA: RNA chaperone Hfq [Syntrophothermus lipocalidus]|uniref:RNA-binding protein Hfq n=1 Tax=Syntrophothermus lipocalidus (strain DSM 12680 / TGB-C1) TaxID=643648 RepID=D7CMC2_SYNLT|nr:MULTISPECIES: RNA chaperone Hfq [Syntrophothermus]ADI01857.1 RNA chaperone Hfq [Syntrophothermus lipocalidus DSM 12680]NSW83052.1 RNA chaperone Hfq [Syntrophothermus sp.]HHV75791.1 RNA chaperone Hfq [Syntrophothermus lipocalidus]HOV42928.1 RNA chaperone Hfq [Syntrophothermus lipocalidus]